MSKNSLDGVYKLSMAIEDEDNFGPPTEDEDLDDIEFEEVGTFQITGDKVSVLDGDTDHIQELIAETFRREGEKKGSVYFDKQIPIANGKPGFTAAFLAALEFWDYNYEKAE